MTSLSVSGLKEHALSENGQGIQFPDHVQQIQLRRYLLLIYLEDIKHMDQLWAFFRVRFGNRPPCRRYGASDIANFLWVVHLFCI
jgi:hypothetical protein